MPYVSDLEEEENNPINGDYDNVQGEGGPIESVHIPNGMAPLSNIIIWSVEGIVEGGDDNQEP